MAFALANEGKVVEFDRLGSDIIECLTRHKTPQQKIQCLEEIQIDVYEDYFEGLSELADDEGLTRNIERFTLEQLDEAFHDATSHFELITPGTYRGMIDVTSGDYVKHICDMLQVRGCKLFNKALKKSGRQFIEGLSPDYQCIGVLGEPTPDILCYICGYSLGDTEDYEKKQGSRCPSACEHVINVFQAMKTILGLYNKQTPRSSIRLLEQTVYKWSCACCNYTKNQINFVKNDSNGIWIVDERAVEETLLAVKEVPNCCKSQFHGKLNIKARKREIVDLLNDICDTLNEHYSPIISSLRELTPHTKQAIIKAIEFICVLSNITVDGIMTVINSVYGKRSIEDDSDSDEKPNRKKTKRGGGNDIINDYISKLNFLQQEKFYIKCISVLNDKIQRQLKDLKTLYHMDLFTFLKNSIRIADDSSTKLLVTNTPIQTLVMAKGGYRRKITKKKKEKHTRHRSYRNVRKSRKSRNK
jgi:hypothetical protein